MSYCYHEDKYYYMHCTRRIFSISIEKILLVHYTIEKMFLV